MVAASRLEMMGVVFAQMPPVRELYTKTCSFHEMPHMASHPELPVISCVCSIPARLPLPLPPCSKLASSTLCKSAMLAANRWPSAHRVCLGGGGAGYGGG